VELDPDETRALLRRVPAIHRTQINDVLLGALARVLCRWTGRERVAVALEGHGREAVFDEIDLSRTVGWFTTLFPVSLDVPGEADWAGVIKAVKRQLRAVPGRGLGYGALRYLGDNLPAVALPQISFNYLGQFDSASGEDGGPFGADLPLIGEDQDMAAERRWLIDVAGSVHDGRIGFSWTYCPAIHREETVRRLADEFMAALREIAGGR
jgi:non-ribosomal peptide synthase protein (TIGR01720 family)